MAKMEFVGFYEPDSDRPGIVVITSYATGDDLDAAWWEVVTQQAWEDEWWLDDPRAARFDGTRDTDPGISEEWAAYVRSTTEPPSWGWYGWTPHRPDCGPDCDYDFCPILTPADSTTDGAFLGARVVLR